MLAIDTNLVVRLLADDDQHQTEKVRSLLSTEEVFVATTVLLETAWVLGSTYKFSRDAVGRALSLFIRLPAVRLEEPVRVNQALDWLSRGMDFADALHLAKADDCEAFVTFDRVLARSSGKLGTLPVRLL